MKKKDFISILHDVPEICNYGITELRFEFVANLIRYHDCLLRGAKIDVVAYKESNNLFGDNPLSYEVYVANKDQKYLVLAIMYYANIIRHESLSMKYYVYRRYLSVEVSQFNIIVALINRNINIDTDIVFSSLLRLCELQNMDIEQIKYLINLIYNNEYANNKERVHQIPERSWGDVG